MCIYIYIDTTYYVLYTTCYTVVHTICYTLYTPYYVLLTLYHILYTICKQPTYARQFHTKNSLGQSPRGFPGRRGRSALRIKKLAESDLLKRKFLARNLAVGNLASQELACFLPAICARPRRLRKSPQYARPRRRELY